MQGTVFGQPEFELLPMSVLNSLIDIVEDLVIHSKLQIQRVSCDLIIVFKDQPTEQINLLFSDNYYKSGNESVNSMGLLS